MQIYIYIYISLTFFIIAFVLPKISIGYPFSLDVVFLALGFAFIGYTMTPIINYLRTKSCFLISLLTILFFILTYTYRYNNIEYVLVAEARYGNIILFMFTALSGILFILFLSILLSKVCNKDSLLVKIGKNTLIIFVCQRLILSPLMKIFEMFNFIIPSIFVILITLIVVIVCSFCIGFVLDKYIPELNGKYTTR